MTERRLRNVFLFGGLFFLLILVALTVDSLQAVTSQRTPPVTDQVASGEFIWQQHDCNDCHTILGIGAYWAPDNTKAADRHDDAWLRQWLTDPQSVEAGVSMPNQHLTPGEIEDLISYFHWVAKIDTNGWPPEPLIEPASPSPPPAAVGIAGD